MKQEEVNLIEQIKKEGYRYIEKPKTIFVPFSFFDNNKESHSMIQLRGKYGWMIQTEII